MSLATTDKVPQECAVLVVAGAKETLLQPEGAMLGNTWMAAKSDAPARDPDVDPNIGEVLKA
jgi:hypothetical protein